MSGERTRDREAFGAAVSDMVRNSYLYYCEKCISDTTLCSFWQRVARDAGDAARRRPTPTPNEYLVLGNMDEHDMRHSQYLSYCTALADSGSTVVVSFGDVTSVADIRAFRPRKFLRMCVFCFSLLDT